MRVWALKPFNSTDWVRKGATCELGSTAAHFATRTDQVGKQQRIITEIGADIDHAHTRLDGAGARNWVSQISQ